MKNLKEIYFKLPVWAQNLGISVYALYRNKLFRENQYYETGERLVKQINEWNQEEVEKWQVKKLSKIVNYAIEHTSFYQDYYGINKVKFNSIKEFKELQTIDKNIVRDHWESIQTDPNQYVFNTQTSGTTGSSLNMRISAKNTAIERAGIHYYRGLFGYKRGDKIASFIGRKMAKSDRTKPPFWRLNYFDNQLMLSNWHIMMIHCHSI